MGLEPGTTKDDVRRCLENWNRGDNGILFLSRAFRLQPGTGWQIDPGILHAPGSLVTYEPQVNSDVFAMFQSEVEGRIIDWSLLIKDVPQENHHDLDYIIGMLDWDANVNPRFGESNKRFPDAGETVRRDRAGGLSRAVGHAMARGWYSAKELTVLPKRTVTVKDAAAYGLIMTQGYGTFGDTAGLDAVDDPVRTDDGGRAVRHRGRRAGGRADRESQRHRSARDAQTFRPGKSGCRAVRGRYGRRSVERRR